MNYELGIRNKVFSMAFLCLSFFLINNFIFLINSASAAGLYFTASSRTFAIGEVIPVKLLVDTENETLNAFEIKVNYPEEFLDLESISDGNSIINFWVKRDVGKDNSFVGVTVGGYKGNNGLLVQLNFRAKKIGRPVIYFSSSSKAHLHDGLGTEVQLDLTRSLQLVIDKVEVVKPIVPPKIPVEGKDINPPEDFTPIIAKSPHAFDNKYFLVFTTQDKESGMDYYEVQEASADKPVDSDWKRTESPYLLEDQELSKYIFVKAVDKAGNERVVGLRPQFKTFPLWFWLIILLLIMLVIILIVFVIIRLIGRKNKENKENKVLENNIQINP